MYFFAFLKEKKLKSISLYSLFLLCILHVGGRAQSASFSSKAQKLIGTFSVYHYKPIDINEQTSIQTVELFMNELDKQGIVLKQSDINQLQTNNSLLFSQIQEGSDSYLKNAQNIYLKALTAVDSILATLLTKKLNFTENDTSRSQPISSHTFFSPDLKYHANRVVRNIKNRCYEKVSNTDGYEKLTEPEFNAKAQEASKTIIANFQNNIKEMMAEADKTVEATLLNAIALRHDPHSNYFTEEQNKEFSTRLSSNVETFGFYFNDDDDGNIVVSYIEPGGSAWISNEVNEGDLFVSVTLGNTTYSNEGNTAYSIQDKLDKTSENKMTLTLKKQNGQLKSIKLIKQKTTSAENSVKGYVLKSKNGNMGYISLPSFYTADMTEHSLPGCANDVAKEILKLEADTIQGLILDLRNNGGGSMQEAMNLAGIFVDEGPLFIYKEKNKKPYLIKDINRGSVFKKPLVLMINEISASASELFSNIVKDYNIGLVVGQISYGKGTAQNVLPLDTNVLHMKNGMNTNSDFIKITDGKFYRLNCTTHQGTGVIPDVILPFTPGYSIYKENKELYYIEPDVIVKKLVYMPNPAINMASILQNSTQRIQASPDFKRYKQSADSVESFLNKPQKFALKFADFKKYKKQTGTLYDSFEQALETKNTDIQCLNNTFDKKITEVNEQAMEFNSRVRESIQKDIFIHEAFYIINDLKTITK